MPLEQKYLDLIRGGVPACDKPETLSALSRLYDLVVETNEKINKLKLNNVDVGSVLSKGDSDLKKFEARKNQALISIVDSEINDLISNLASCDLLFLKEEKHTLEEYFMKFYEGDDNV